MKQTKNIKLKAGRKSKAEKKAAAAAALQQRRRLWAIGGVVALVVVIAWFMLVPAKKETLPAPSPSRTVGTGGNPNPQPPASTAAPSAGIPEKPRAFLQAVRLQPSDHTRLGSLKAEVEVAPDAPGELTYTYRWKVNGRVIEEATGDTLHLSAFKKRDLVTVTVTPHDGDTAGFAVESPVIAIYSVPPSLELKAVRQARKIGEPREEPLELQLVGVAPDGKLVAFSLESPYVSGMTIDKRSGKISWRRQPDRKGTFRFGAAVEDDNRTKVTKIFAVTVE